MDEVTKPETWYRTQAAWRGQRIVPVQVARYTEHSVYLVGEKGRHPRIGQYDCYFPTWDRAYQLLLAEAEREVDSANGRLARANEDLKKIQELRRPDSATPVTTEKT